MLQFLDAAGNDIGLRENDHGPGGGYIGAVPTSPVMLQPGSAAYVLVAKYRCDLAGTIAATGVRVSLPGGGNTTILALDPGHVMGAIENCGDPEDPGGRAYAVSPFQSPLPAADR